MLNNKKLLSDLLTIILIIILSYVFLMTTSNEKCGTFNYQLMFITFGLCILVLHKIIYTVVNNSNCTSNINTTNTINTINTTNTIKQRENFDDLSSEIGDFINTASSPQNALTATNVSTLDTTTLNTYINTLNQLQTQLNNFNTTVGQLLNNQQNSTQTQSNSNDIIGNRMSVESQEALQSYQIEYLQNQINKAKNLINAQLVQQNSSKYKPIKVYSSCAVANANGTLSSTSGIPNAFTNVNNPPIQMTPQTNNLLNTIGQTSGQTQQLQNGNIVTALAQLINGLQGKTITI